MGIIAIEGIRQKSPVGVHEKERIYGSDLQVDIYLHTSQKLTYSKLSDGFDYGLLYTAVMNAMKQPAFLLEEVIKRIFNEVVAQIKNRPDRTKYTKLKIRVSKFNPPLEGTTDRTYIEDSFDLKSV